MLSLNDFEHVTNGLVESDEDGPRDDGKADGHFRDVRDRFAEKGEIVVVESVSGMNAESGLVRDLCPMREAPGLFLVRRLRRCVRVIARVQFDRVRPCIGCCLDLLCDRVHEQRDLLNARIVELRDHGVEPVAVCFDIETALGRYFLPALRNECREVGSYVAADVYNLCICRQLKVELSFYCLPKEANIPVRDVAAIFAEMKDDPARPGLFADRSRVHGVREGLAARIAKRADVVDVDEEPGHKG